MKNSHTLFSSVRFYLSLQVTYEILFLYIALLGQLLSKLNTTNLFNISSCGNGLINTSSINMAVYCKHLHIKLYIYSNLHGKSVGASTIPTA